MSKAFSRFNVTAVLFKSSISFSRTSIILLNLLLFAFACERSRFSDEISASDDDDDDDDDDDAAAAAAAAEADASPAFLVSSFLSFKGGLDKEEEEGAEGRASSTVRKALTLAAVLNRTLSATSSSAGRNLNFSRKNEESFDDDEGEEDDKEAAAAVVVGPEKRKSSPPRVVVVVVVVAARVIRLWGSALSKITYKTHMKP